MSAWLLKQLVQIIVRYVIALLVGVVFVSLAHFFIINAISNSFLARIMILDMFLLMVPSVLVWHVLAQLLNTMRIYKRHTEIKSSLITVVLAFAGIEVFMSELTSAATLDLIILFVSTFTIAAGFSFFAFK
tara:strand:- start:112 stop:504 length:393 start_codon:yes stop_codon:yes gene_type:complete